MIGKGRIVVSDKEIVLRVPKIALALVQLLVFLLFPFKRGKTLGLLVSHSGCLSALATDKQCSASYQANELKLFHIGRSKWTNRGCSDVCAKRRQKQVPFRLGELSTFEY